MILLLLLFTSLIGLIVYWILLRRAVKEIPQLSRLENEISNGFLDLKFPKVSVIIPAYNEADNIEDCIRSVLDSTRLSSDNLEVWVIDDQSTDNTFKILQNFQQYRQDPRLKILPGLDRPEAEIWTGKNWACAQGAKCSKGEFLVFIDADIRLKSGAIERVVLEAIVKEIDFLNCIPAIICGCIAEWLIQPLIFINLLISFNSRIVKNPKTDTAYAAGFFMLFKRSAYEEIQGHQAVASYVAEDVALARLIKKRHFKIGYRLGANIATLRMYTSWTTLWEGWTKVLYVGAQRNLIIILCLALVMLIIYTIPWIGLIINFTKISLINIETIDLYILTVIMIDIIIQYKLRKLLIKALNLPPKYWWLNGLGGLILATIAVVSFIKTETGWGWTWRSRSLKQCR
ncbi:family 2 glycosyl transferase [Kalymmatonema gypsitolerans NIES-4073]|nr:family 2 glycosyl transferase [Scytonema sp. NIES-4073]